MGGAHTFGAAVLAGEAAHDGGEPADGRARVARRCRQDGLHGCVLQHVVGRTVADEVAREPAQGRGVLQQFLDGGARHGGDGSCPAVGREDSRTADSLPQELVGMGRWAGPLTAAGGSGRLPQCAVGTSGSMCVGSHLHSTSIAMKDHLVSGLPCLLFAVALGAHLPAQSVGWVPVRQVAIENDPAGYSSGRMTATDSARGVLVSFGCHDAQSGIADTWEWGGSHWTPRDPARVPAWRTDAMFVYDPQRGRHRDVRRLRRHGEQLSHEPDLGMGRRVLGAADPSPAPNPRGGCAGAYDEARNRIVMFGGVNLTDTWEFDGTAWTQRFPANSPSARTYHSMVYDRIRQRVLLHGGNVSGAANGETWEWDGANWTLLANYGPFVRNFAYGVG